MTATGLSSWSADVDELTDQVVLAAAVRGDQQAFELLVRRHTGRMYRVALRVVGEPTDAEDVVQDAWIAAWRGLSAYRADAAPTTWLYRVVTNAALGHLRRRRPTVALEQAGSAHLVDTDPGPEAAAVRSDDVVAVRQALSRLEPGQRAVLVLREFEELSYQEVAQVLDTTVPAVRSRLQRGRVALHDHLARERTAR